MPWIPGQSGNPNGYQGPRNGTRHKIHREVLERIQGLGHTDALITLSEIQNDQKNELALRVSAATALAPFTLTRTTHVLPTTVNLLLE
jgi:hypothetical protein